MRLAIAVTVASALAAQSAGAGEARYDLSVDLGHDDNATRGLYGPDRKSSEILTVDGSVSASTMLESRAGIVLRAGARYSHYSQIEDISNLVLYGRAAWRLQPGTDFSSPWVELAGQLRGLKHAGSALRDGTIVSLDASSGSYLTDRVRLAAGLGFDKRSGGGSAGLYDLSTSRLWGTFDYRVGVRNSVYLRLTRVDGDHVFNSVTVSGLSNVWEADTALAGALGRPADAYRLEATTLLYELGFSMPLERGHGLDFSLSGFRSKSDSGGFEYDGTLFRAGYLYRFR